MSSTQWVPPWETKTIVTMWVLYKHMLMDQQPSICSHVAKRGHVKRSYDRIVANELDVLLCKRLCPWLVPTKLEALSRIAEKLEQLNMDCHGALARD